AMPLEVPSSSAAATMDAETRSRVTTRGRSDSGTRFFAHQASGLRVEQRPQPVDANHRAEREVKEQNRGDDDADDARPFAAAEKAPARNDGGQREEEQEHDERRAGDADDGHRDRSVGVARHADDRAGQAEREGEQRRGEQIERADGDVENRDDLDVCVHPVSPLFLVVLDEIRHVRVVGALREGVREIVLVRVPPVFVGIVERVDAAAEAFLDRSLRTALAVFLFARAWAGRLLFRRAEARLTRRVRAGPAAAEAARSWAAEAAGTAARARTAEAPAGTRAAEAAARSRAAFLPRTRLAHRERTAHERLLIEALNGF